MHNDYDNVDEMKGIENEGNDRQDGTRITGSPANEEDIYSNQAGTSIYICKQLRACLYERRGGRFAKTGHFYSVFI